MTHTHAFLELDPTHQHADLSTPSTDAPDMSPEHENVNILEQPIGWHYEEPVYG